MEPKFGKHQKTLPEVSRHESADYWVAVGRHAKENPSVWIELKDCHLSVNRLSGICTLVKQWKDLARIPQGIRFRGFTCQVRQKTLWFRYDPPIGGVQ